MNTATMEDRLAEVGRRIDKLQARARAGAAEAKPRIQRHLDALRHEEESVRVAAATSSDKIEDEVGQLKTRVEVAEHSLAADVSDDHERFSAAVSAELGSLDTYFERLQTKAAAKTGTAREQAEAAIGDLRKRRIAVAERLAQARGSSGDAWREQKKRVAAAREELEQKADELSAKLRR